MADHTVRFAFAPKAGSPADRKGALTLLSGKGAGLVIALADTPIVIGRTSEATIVIEDDGLSRKHARFLRMQRQYFVEDLESTNGTFVNGVATTEPVRLDDGDTVQLGSGTVVRFSLRDEAEIDAARRTYERTVKDPLTGAYNRHFLDERLVSELAFAQRHGVPLTVMFVDADHFKRVNDTHGHAAGDEVLRRLSQLLESTLRAEDIVARYGGEEFVLVLRGVPTTGALAVAERVRVGVETLKIGHAGKWIPVTVSVGVATHSKEREVDSVAALLALADGALYRAKGSGRNRVVLA
jgi:two-component system, cell cycle response regulator